MHICSGGIKTSVKFKAKLTYRIGLLNLGRFKSRQTNSLDSAVLMLIPHLNRTKHSRVIYNSSKEKSAVY